MNHSEHGHAALQTQVPRRGQRLLAALTLAVASVATPAAFAQPMMDMHGGMGGPGMAMGGMGAMGPMGRMLGAVNATADQRAQIQQIMQAAMTDLKAQREAARSLHQQSMALFAQPTIDARAVEALRQQMLAQHDAASKRMTQAMVDASNVLTAEQRKSMANLMSQRQALMERQRAERAALDNAAK